MNTDHSPTAYWTKIAGLIQKEESGSFLKLLFTNDKKIARIDAYYQFINTLVKSFRVS